MDDIKDYIAQRAAKELCNGSIVNLGIGIPIMVANYVPEGITIQLQSENGFVGLGPKPSDDNADPYITNAGGMPASILDGGSFFDSSTSFGIIRGGHLDITILGALQVDEHGNLANWIIPGKLVPGMGGAMDLVVGAKKVIVAMEHTNKGNPKIKKKCSLPLTAASCVDMIITEMCVMQFKNNQLYLTEINPVYTLDQVRQATEAEFIVEI
jgi:acetate CoA/acetoacetate CoA-transferase beta subunit